MPPISDPSTQASGLRGRRVLITGASLGIGSTIAQSFVQHGAVVAVHHCAAADSQMGHHHAAAELLAQLQVTVPACVAVEQDLEVEGAGTRLVEQVCSALGDIDIVVLCASAQSRERFDEIRPLAVRRLMRINFESSIEILQGVLPPMRTRKWGRIIAIGSVNQMRPDPQLGIYSALKAAHHNLMVNLAKSEAPFGITLNTISPGLIATPRNAWRRVDPEDWQRIERNANPMARAGTPMEVAPLALLLASPAGAFMTGTDLAVDGGARL